MKIGIVAANHLRYSPYVFYYTKILDEQKIEYEIILPDKTGVKDEVECIVHYVPWNQKGKSAINYFLFSQEVKKIINKRKYNGLIILTSINCSYLAIYLTRLYRNKYIVDIRDYTHENIVPYRMLEKIGINNAALRVISSSKFQKFLPDNEYYVCHNMNSAEGDVVLDWKKPTGRVVIGHVGTIAYKKTCKQLIDLVKQDNRFEFHIYGRESEEKEIYNLVNELNCDRIKYFGPYLPSDKEKILGQVDILFNTYGHNSPLLDFALSNKLYDAFCYKKLLLTSPGTYMAEMGGPIAYSLDYEKATSLDDLYSWVCELQEKKILEYQKMMVAKIIDENSNTKYKIIKTVNAWC